MDRKTFWELQDRTRQAANNDGELQAELLVETLVNMSVADILSYEVHFDELTDQAYRADIWDAAEIISGSCGDDSFSDFRAWLVGQGQKVYENTLADPDSLADVVELGDQTQIQSLNYVYVVAFERSTGLDSLEMPVTKNATKAVPFGYFLDKSDLLRRFPKLCTKFI